MNRQNFRCVAVDGPHTGYEWDSLNLTPAHEATLGAGTTRSPSACYEYRGTNHNGVRLYYHIGDETADGGAPKTTKLTNPKDAIGSNKASLASIPLAAMAYEAPAYTNGGLKYGNCNWRVAGVRASIYLDAALRHLMCWREGEEVDPDDGVHNLGAARACLGILIDAIENGMLNDDRPTAARDPRGALRKAEELGKSLRELHKDRNPVHHFIGGRTQGGHTGEA